MMYMRFCVCPIIPTGAQWSTTDGPNKVMGK